MRVLLALLLAASTAGCASAPGGERGESDYARLRRECRERGGVLLASFGRLTGQPQIDNVCELRGGPGRSRNAPFR